MAEWREIPIDAIVPPPHPVREAMDEAKLEELAASIRAVGIIQPLIVCPQRDAGDGESANGSGRGPSEKGAVPERFEIVAGHRRYIAGKFAGLAFLPCVVYPEESIAKAAVMLHENTYREDLTPAEEARFYQELIERYDLTEEALLRTVRQSAYYVYSRLELLKGDEAVFKALSDRKITLSVAQQLNKVDDDRKLAFLLHEAIEHQAPARVVMQWVADWKRQNLPPLPSLDSKDVVVETGMPAVALPYCFCCGSTLDPHNLVSVNIHRWELDIVRRTVGQFLEAGGRV